MTTQLLIDIDLETRGSAIRLGSNRGYVTFDLDIPRTSVSVCPTLCDCGHLIMYSTS